MAQERLTDEEIEKIGVYTMLMVNAVNKQGPGICDAIQIFLGTSGRERWLLNHGIRRALVTPTVGPVTKAQLLQTFVNSSPDPLWFGHAVHVLAQTSEAEQNMALRSAIATFSGLQRWINRG